MYGIVEVFFFGLHDVNSFTLRLVLWLIVVCGINEH